MKARLVAIALTALLPLIGACGFTPLYAQPGLAGNMGAVSVETPQTRTGFLLRQALEDALAYNRNVAPQYRLVVEIDQRRRPRGLQSDDTPSRYETRLMLNYTLTRIAGGQVVMKKTRPIFVSADASTQPYAGIAAQEDAELRAASEAADMIKVDVALALSGQ